MSDIGWASLQIVPVAGKGFGNEIGKQVNPGLGTAGTAGGKAFGSGMLASARSFATPLAGVFAGAMAGGAIASFFKDAAGAAMEDQKSVVALSKAMDNLGLSHRNVGVEKFVADMQAATGTADDVLRPSIQRLLTATGDVTKSQQLMSLAMNVSAGTGKGLESVTQALSRASMGNLSALTRLGVPLDANTIKSKDFGAATDELSKKFAGQASAAAATFSGKLLRLTTAADEAKETIGYALLNAVDGFADSLGGTDGAINLIDSMAQGVADSIGNFQTLTRTIDDLVDRVNSIPELPGWIRGAWDFLGQGRDLGVNALGSMIPGFGGLGMDLLQQGKDALDSANDERKATEQWAKGVADFYAGGTSQGLGIPVHRKPPKPPGTDLPGGGLAKQIADEISATYQSALSQAGARVAAFMDADAAGFGKVGLSSVQRLVDGIKIKGSEKTSQAIQDMLGKALDAAQSKIDGAVEFGKSISDGILQGLDIGNAATGWQDRQDAVKAALADLMDAQKAINAESTQAEKDRVTQLQGIYQTAQADAAKGGASIVDAFVIEANKAGEFATKLQGLLKAGMNETTWLQIAEMSSVQGVKVIDAFYDGNIAENIKRTNDAVTAVDSVAKQVGNQAINTFKAAGIEMAIGLLESMTKILTAGNTKKGFTAAIAGLREDLKSIMDLTAQVAGSPSGGFIQQAASVTPAIDWSTPVNAAILEQNHWAFENLPMFADGGIVTKPTLGIFGEAGPEAVIPLDYFDSFARGSAGQMNPNGSLAAAPTVNVTFIVDGQEFRGMMRTEIALSDEQKLNYVRQGARR